MKAFAFFAACLVFAPSANADAPTENPSQPATTSDPSIVKPKPIGRHDCLNEIASWVRSGSGSKSATVHVTFTIAVDGTLKDVVVDSSSGDANLDAITIKCVERWRYEPATKDGQPVELPWSAGVRYWHG